MMGTRVRLGLAAGFSLLGSLALADVKVVSSVLPTNSTLQPSSKVTTYYKGNGIRIESPEGVWIIDAAAGKTVILNPKAKTYSELTAGLDPELMKQMKMTVKAHVDSTNQRRVIAGKSASKYLLHVELTTTMEKPAKATEKVTIDMEIWATTETQSPISAEQTTGLISQTFAPLGSFSHDPSLTREFAKIKGLQLSATTKMVMAFNAPGGNGWKKEAHTVKMGYMSEAQAVSEEELDPGLFQVPAGYTLAAPVGPRP